jgi:hypothetical protein
MPGMSRKYFTPLPALIGDAEKSLAPSGLWTLKAIEVSQCQCCGTQTFWFGGKTCRECYGDPQIRADYLNQGARKKLPFPRYKTAFAKVPVKRLTSTRLKMSIERCVPVNLYVPARPYPKPLHLRKFGRGMWRRPRIILPKLRDPIAAYPFVRKVNAGSTDLLLVNSLVPTGLPGREDICQEIMLALLEKRITIEQLKAARSNIRAFINKFKRENYEEGGFAISLDEPRHDGQSWHDVLSTDSAGS